MKDILNISAYRFVALDDPDQWRGAILAQANAAGLRGTVLLAHEGINLFLAGNAQAVRGFLGWLAAQAPFAGIEAKESWSADVPFGRLLVKVKREIIRMNQPTVRPEQARAPAVGARTLARWLDRGSDDTGRPIVMLDTRNAFEVEHGRFRDGVHWDLQRFSDFPAALAERAAELQGKTVVSYCTGGIRCEKAALWMAEQGMDRVWQLDGGILKYFEDTGGTHFDGSCFVFDERTALGPTLAPVETM
ncbi:MAG: sulfurtransferase [Proteobacteria bacterium]|nr:sulfurtransferase [Pseudomonadota bacterium]